MAMGADQAARLRWGALATIGTAALAGAFGGLRSAGAAAIFGGLATLVQLGAARLTAKAGAPAGVDQLRTYLVGVGLRFGGVAVLGLAVALDRDRFPAVASALGYVGTILPLLALETRLTR
jgi:hypothetical protein